MSQPPPPRGYCPQCNYPMNPGRCPECGTISPPGRLLLKPRAFGNRVVWRWWLAGVALLTATIAYYLAGLIPWYSLLPSDLLIYWAEPSANTICQVLWKRSLDNQLTDDQLRRFLARAYVVDVKPVRKVFASEESIKLARSTRFASLPGIVESYEIHKKHPDGTIQLISQAVDGAGPVFSWHEPPGVHEITLTEHRDFFWSSVASAKSIRLTVQHVLRFQVTAEPFESLPVIDSEAIADVRMHVLIPPSMDYGHMQHANIPMIVDGLRIPVIGTLWARPAGASTFHPLGTIRFGSEQFVVDGEDRGSQGFGESWLDLSEMPGIEDAKAVDIRIIPDAQYARKSHVRVHFGCSIEVHGIPLLEQEGPWQASLAQQAGPMLIECPTLGDEEAPQPP